MKSKVIFFIAGAAVVTLSFTFVTNNARTAKVVAPAAHTTKVAHNEPTGGFVSEDKF